MEPDSVKRVVILGDAGVGKTTLVTNLVTGYISDSHCSVVQFHPSTTHRQPTMGVEFYTKVVSYKHSVIRFQLLDIPGEHIYQPLLHSYIAGSDACIFLFDVNNQESFNGVERWYSSLQQERVPPHMLYYLVGNKVDMVGDTEQEAVLLQECNKYAQIHHMNVAYISSLSIENITSLFRMITSDLSEVNETRATDTSCVFDPVERRHRTCLQLHIPFFCK